MVAQSEAFTTAVLDSKKLLAKPDNSELLKLYGLYKVGTAEDFSAAPKPGTFELRAKAKYNAWKDIVEEGTTPEQAQEKYAALTEQLKAKYGYDANKVPEPLGGKDD